MMGEKTQLFSTAILSLLQVNTSGKQGLCNHNNFQYQLKTGIHQTRHRFHHIFYNNQVHRPYEDSRMLYQSVAR